MSLRHIDDGPSSSGISRRKTGCWTCRIRRKKCDEVADPEGRCQACVRLKIPCAGWGEKRPEWAKDEETLRLFKERIKKQLMSRAPNRIATGGPVPKLTDDTDKPLDEDTINEDETMYRAQTSSMSQYPEYGHSFPMRGPQSQEMFDYPGYAARLYSIAQAAQLPQEYMTFVFQTAELEQWKSLQDSNGTLSYRELARRGKVIEKSLHGQISGGSTSYSPGSQSSSLTPTSYPIASTPPQCAGNPGLPLPSQPVFANAVAQLSQSQLIFMDACLFMLHSVVSGPNPRVPELAHAARNITTRFSSIPAQQRTISLLFPLCIAGTLAENAEIQYIQAQINTLGAPVDLLQAVNGLIVNVGQSRWTHELNHANSLMA